MSGLEICGNCDVCGKGIFSGEKYATITLVKFIGFEDSHLPKLSERFGLYCWNCCGPKIAFTARHDRECSCCGRYIGGTIKNWKIVFELGVIDLPKMKAKTLRKQTMRSFCANCAEKKMIYDAIYYAIHHVVKPSAWFLIPKLDRSGDPINLPHLEFCPGPRRP